MKSGLRQIIALVSAILLSIIMPAQNLPVMPGDPSVISGVLPNGMSYYVASNASHNGMADFALVQKTGSRNAADSAGCALDEARKALVSLPRLGGGSPVDFFLYHGSSPDEEGFVDVTDDATVFRFRNVRISDGPSVLDSALLVLLDITDRVSFSQDPFLKKWYSPSDQAVVVAGDVDARTVASRLEAMSYMTPARESSGRTMPQSEIVQDSSVVRTADPSGLCVLSAEWVSKRVPREYMNTVQPQIFDMSLDVLGRIAEGRMKEALKSADIPYAEVSFRHISSDKIPYDDSFTVRAVVSADDAEEVSGIMSGVMAALDSEGAGNDEYLIAEAEFLSVLKEAAEAPFRDNSSYIDRCISSFLYNSSLSSPEQVYAFHTSRNLPDSMRVRLFNDVADALLYPLADSPVEVEIPVRTPADTSVFPGIGPKVKIRSSRRDHLSGGTVMTFSNGFRVVYKDMPSNGCLYYTLALNGGYGGIQGLSEGEGAFVSDIFSLSRISGLDGDDFKSLLKKEGIAMEARVTLSNILIGGYLPEDRLSLLMRSLLALANERTANEDAYRYYRECEELALEYEEGHYSSRMTAIDSILCPGYRYSPYKSKGRLTDSFHSKADAFLSSQMEKMNDGVLVIVGDMGLERLKKMLLQYVGGFKTKETAFRRPVLRYQPVSGWSTYTVEGERNAVDIAISARMPLTSSNHISAQIAMMLLENRLADALADSGMAFDLSWNCRIYPEERLNLLISVYEADQDGFAVGLETKSPIDVLSVLRRVLADMVSWEIPEDDLKRCRKYIANRMGRDTGDPIYWVDAIVLRYLDGKDLTTGYSSNIDAASENNVRNVLSFLDQGSKVEYVTSKRYVPRNDNTD